MTLFLNRCIWNPTAGGITDFVVASAFAGAYTPAQCLDPIVTDGGSYHYFAQTADNTQHEEGDGIYSVATATLTRATIRNSSNGGAKVNFNQAPIVTMGGPTSLEILPIQVNATTNPDTLTIQAPSVPNGVPNTAGNLFTFNGSFGTGIGEPGFLAFNTGFVGYDVGHTLSSISNGSPAVFTTAVNHNLFGGQCILLQTTGALPSPLATLTTYFVDSASLATNTFEVSLTFGGAVINTTTNGSGTHSYVPGGLITSLNQSVFASGPVTLFITAFGGGTVNGMVVQFQSTGTLPTGLSPNTNYFVINTNSIGGYFAVSASQIGAPLTCTGGTGTLTFQIQGGIQNQPLFGTGFIVGPSNLVGNDSQPLFQITQDWNTSQTSAPFAGLDQCLLALTINNLRSATQRTRFSRYQPIATNLNTLTIEQDPNPTGGSWLVTANGPGAPCIELHNDNWPDDICGVIGNPVQFATQPSSSVTLGGPAPIAVQLGYDNTNGIAAFSNPTPSSPTGIRAYNQTDTNTGSPTNYERVAVDFITTPNVATIGTQAGGSGTLRDFSVVKGTNTFFTSKVFTVTTLPAATAGLQGSRLFVTDASVASFNTIVAVGGGTNIMPVFCDGTNWRIG